jgi:hypothetical protein
MPIPAPVGRWARWTLFWHSQRPWPMVEPSPRVLTVSSLLLRLSAPSHGDPSNARANLRLTW